MAYAATTGTPLWTYRNDGLAHDRAADLEVTPDGSFLYVTGTVEPNAGEFFVNVAQLATATGADRGVEVARGMGRRSAVSPDGLRFVLAGARASDFLVEKHDLPLVPFTHWERLYDGPDHGKDNLTDLAVTPDSASAIVVGSSESAAGGLDYALVGLVI